jgi:hypothetical protein
VSRTIFGEPGHTRLYVGLPSAWDSADGDRISFPVNELVECMKALGMGTSFHGGPVGEPGRAFFSLAFQRQAKVCFGDGVSLSMRAMRREPGRGPPLLGFVNDMCRRPW